MHILLLTHYYPPEVNAPAIRSADHARRWVARGHRVTVVTSAPNHPRGKIYPGYANRPFARATVDGVDVIRLWTYLAANEGTIPRIANYVSYFLAVLFWMWRLPRADVVLSTSPQFFCGMAGGLLQRKHRPWVLEIRDLWPESVVAVGAMKPGRIIRLIEKIERAAYRRADLVVSVTESFLAHIAPHRAGRPIAVVRNGVTPGALDAEPGSAEAFKAAHGLTGKFVAAYIGTHGMAHGLDSALDAAERLRTRPDIAIVLIGEGAQKARLRAAAAARGLTNLVMIDQQPRAAISAIWAATDAALVLLKRSDTFLSVLPSKMFEALATRTPVILGVAGESQRMLDASGGGIAVPPEDGGAIADAIISIADNPAAAARMGAAGYAYFQQHLDREVLADLLLDEMMALKR